MPLHMLIDARHPEETRVAVVRGNRIEDFDFEAAEKKQLKGNIYLAKVTRVEPSLQAAFVEYGGNRHGFLPFSEIHPDYYQIPTQDREALLMEEHDAAGSQLDEAPEPVEGAGENGETTEAGGHEEEAAQEAMRRRRHALRRRYKIQEVIKRRQILLIQVVKEERGGKGAALTSYLSLAGRYCVLMPNTSGGGGISRKISNQADRRQLKSIMADLKLPTGMGCIIRTAGMKRTKTEIKRDFDYLTRLWDDIRELTLKSSAPALIHEDSNLIKRAIRDVYTREVDELMVEGEAGYRAAKDFMRLLMPSHAKKVQLYKESTPLFHRYQVESQLETMYQPTVTLKSGGYIVLNQTEALVSIDINSGRSTREHNIEETALKTNLEASDEIARQLRLRDLAGLVVIDYIDMEDKSSIRQVERRIKDAVKNDRARIQLGRISNFGLFEMSRQRLRTGVLEASTHVCETCHGAGFVRSVPSSALHILRTLEEEAVKGHASELTVKLSSEVAFYLLNNKRPELSAIETRYGVTVSMSPDPTKMSAEHEIEKAGPPPVVGAPPPVPFVDPEDERDATIADDEDDVVEPADAEDEAGDEGEADRTAKSTDRQRDDRNEERGDDKGDDRGRRRRRRRRRRGGREPSDAVAAPNGETSETPAETEVPAEGEEQATGDRTGDRRRRRRGRRGGRGRDGENEAGARAAPTGTDGGPSEAVDAGGVVAEADVATPHDVPTESPVTAPDDVATAAADEVVPEAPVEKPKRVRRPRASTARPKRAGTDPTPELALEPEAEPTPPKVQPVEAPEAQAEPSGAASSEPMRSLAANAVAEPMTITEPPKLDGPPRKGWWQRTFGP